MIQFEEASIQSIIFHKLNGSDKSPTFSNSLSDFKNDEEEEVLKKIFLKPFLTAYSTGEFSHEINVSFNPLYKLSKSVQSGEDFIEQSKSICKYLNSVSTHPNIKEGELFILKFENIKLNDRFYGALGIYKIENKESFIEPHAPSAHKVSSLVFRKGIGSRKPDKACLIVFTEDPFTLFVIDNAKTETDYWQNEFIRMSLKDDAMNNTNEFLALTKSFVTKALPEDITINKADQIDLLNKSVDYFKTHDRFDKQEFENEVLQDENVIDSFRKYNSAHREDSEDTNYRFDISQQAVKRQARIFKSVLKLDKNFHIYIHGDRELIEQGVDSDGRKFYKLYYQSES